MMLMLQKLVVASVFILQTLSSSTADEKTSLFPRIQSMFIRSDVYSRYANVQIRSVVVNDAFDGREARFTVQLPEDAFITEFKMTSDNTTIYGVVKEKKEAQQAYDDAVQQGQTAGQVVQVAPPSRAMKTFSVLMNVAGNSTSVFELTYEELVKRVLGNYKQAIHIEPNQIVPNITLLASFTDTKMIEDFAYSLPGSKVLNSVSNAQNGVELYASYKRRWILYTPDVAQQQSHDQQKGIQGNFVIEYDTAHANDGGTIILEGGAFVHYFSPEGLSPLSKNIVFVIDVSGSMSGMKINQTRIAMLKILKLLRVGDNFNLILFNGTVHPWKQELCRADDRYISEAEIFVNKFLIARGSTNINDALTEGIRTLREYMTEEKNRGSVIVFLTDGQPTAGETNEAKIINNIVRENGGTVAIFCLAFGSGVSFKFLQELALKNGGTAVKIYDENDAADQLGDFYAGKESILLRDIVFKYPSDFVRSEDLTKTTYDNYFLGSELVIAGTCLDESASPSSPFIAQVKAQGRANEVIYDVSIDQDILDAAPKSYTKRVVAYLKIKHYIDKALVSKGEMKKLYEDKALNMSLEYGFVTEYTSMVVTQSVHKGPSDTRMMDMSAVSGASMNGFRRKAKFHPHYPSGPASTRDLTAGGEVDGGLALLPALSMSNYMCLGLFVIFTALF